MSSLLRTIYGILTPFVATLARAWGQAPGVRQGIHRLATVATVCVAIAALLAATSASAADSHAPSAAVPESVRVFLENNCLDCHEGEHAEANFDVTALSDEVNADNLQRWVRSFDRVHAGEMPPADAEPPAADDRQAFLRDSAAWLKAFQNEQTARIGRVQARRLTNLQLERSLHAVLGVDIPLAKQLPDEPRSGGFTTVADGQSMSHFQLEQHLQIVDTALDEAFRRATGADAQDDERRELSARKVARQNPRRRCREPEMIGEDAVVWSSNLTFYGRLPATTAKHDGWYRFKIRASALKKPDDHGVWCSVRTGRCVSSAPLYGWVGSFCAQNEPQEWTFEAWLERGEMIEVRPGDNTLKKARFAGGQAGAGEGGPQDVPGIAIHSVDMQRIHHGPDNQGIRELLFAELTLRPARKREPAVLNSDAPKADAARLLHRFAERAFRRDVDPQEITHYVSATQQAIADGQPLLDAVRDGYRALLCSPNFLYFHEAPGRLDHHAVATRLSYFLTGAPPDDTLRRLAAEKRLHDPDVLIQQVDRLLEDHDEQFIRDFANQWLDLSEINFTEPDRKLYREFDVVVQQSMVSETETFLTDLLRRDAPTARLIDSEYTFLNNRLARFYDIDGVQGDAIQKVTLDESTRRGGVLTQGAILKVTANGTTTSPVIRGVWISERLLGESIPPPPESVPAIEPDVRGANTIRELLEKHRSDTSCASCHVKIDPPGFALENFDPAGSWRTHYFRRGNKQGAKIDPSYQWPDGASFADITEFRQRVLADPEKIAANVAEKMVVYGTGGEVSFADREAIEAMVRSTRKSDYGFRSILNAVVTSDLFLTK
ncbi:DUF1592 domain-containing protein [Roseimaritima ulvae]|nr:DUF1592 domain-containing protein [Roseimaritima ulvae]